MDRDMAQEICVFPFGDFGIAAANALKELMPVVSIMPEVMERSLSDLDRITASAFVFTSSRSSPLMSDHLDERSHALGVPFVSLILRNDHIQMGPTVVPDCGPCWRCWATRELQADPSPVISQRVADYYSKNLSLAPKGFLPSLAALGAARLAQILGHVGKPSLEGFAGSVTRLSLIGRTTASGQVTGIDNCDRCGMKRSVQSRSYADLRLALAHLWN